MSQKSTIIVRFTTAGLFGDEGSAGYDEEASADEFRAQVLAKLRKAYQPDEWDIDIARSDTDRIEVDDAGGHALPDEASWIGNMMTEVHETWDWAVGDAILA